MSFDFKELYVLKSLTLVTLVNLYINCKQDAITRNGMDTGSVPQRWIAVGVKDEIKAKALWRCCWLNAVIHSETCPLSPLTQLKEEDAITSKATLQITGWSAPRAVFYGPMKLKVKLVTVPEKPLRITFGEEGLSLSSQCYVMLFLLAQRTATCHITVKWNENGKIKAIS